MDNDTMVAVTPEDYALAETVVHASNIVSHDGYYEVDIDRAAQAIARHQSGRTGAGEACWLIERRCNPPQWSVEPSPTGVGAFYSDIHRAHRFATKQEAAEAMRRMSITPKERGEYFVSEHVWIEGEKP